MEQKYIIDTNVIIDKFGNKLNDTAKSLLNNIAFNISVITKIEVLGWHNVTQQQLAPLIKFMGVVNILPIDDTIINKTIELRQTKKIALGDAIITATALVNNLILISRNTKDFKNIEGLKVVDPYNL